MADELKAEGNAALKANDAAGAIAKYTEAIALEPSHLLYSNRSAAHAQRGDWEAAAAQVELSPPAGTQPSPTVDMLLKAALLASQLLVSPNNLKEIQEAALARFYVNEAAYALELISRAVAKQDREAALFAYDFGRDSWNSYIAVVNRAIPEKVGDKFEPLPS